MDNDKKNEKALLWGFLLIILVVLVFVSKNYYSGKSGSSQKDTDTQSADNLKKMPQISDGELSKKILARSPLFIFDIRDSDSFKVEHIIDSKNVSVEDLSKILSSPEKNKTYVVVDYTGENSAAGISSDILEAENIYFLSGGFAAWKNNKNSTISFGDATSFVDQSKVRYVKSEELKKMIDENAKNLYLIDVRNSDSFKTGRIKNATNIFVDDLESRRKEIPLGKKIIVYDKDGLLAYEAAVRLFDLGIINVFALSDGLDGWNQKGYEVVK